MSDAVISYGWEALPRDPSIVLDGKNNIKDPQPQTVASIKLPDSTLAASVLEYAQKELSTETFNHSMRVYYYGMTSSMSIFDCLLTHRQARLSISSNSRSGNSPTKHTY